MMLAAENSIDVLNNVDICITCISHKPPVLPLREELVSLGIEVVLTAHGTGAKASHRQAMKLVRQFREQEMAKDKKRRLLPRSRKRLKQKMEQRKRIELELRTPKGLSYETYYQKLYSDDKSSTGSSVSSLDSHVTMQTAEKKLMERQRREGWGFFRSTKNQQPKPPTTTIHFPSLEYLAVKDAFAAFGSMTTEQALSTMKKPCCKHESESSLKPDVADAFASFDADNSIYAFADNGGTTKHKQNKNEGNVSDGEDSTIDVRQPTDDSSSKKKNKPPVILVSGKNWWYENGGTYDTGDDNAIFEEDRRDDEQPASDSSSSSMRWQNSSLRVFASHATACCSLNQLDSPKAATTNKNTSTLLLREWDRHQLVNGDPAGQGGDASVASPTRLRKREQSQMRLYSTLRDSLALPGHIQSMLEADPDLVKTVMDDGRLALHAACDRALPDRFHSKSGESNIVYHLISDISNLKSLVELVAYLHLDGCLVPDDNGDLPLHLLARRLLIWEGTWRKKLREPLVSHEEAIAMSLKLHRIMSECIETVIRPVATSREQCRRQGSTGCLLPLHVAAIFGVWCDTIRALLETFPEAARIKCNISGLVSYIRNDSCALQLHDRLTVLFPRVHGSDTSERSENTWEEEDFYQTSDLLFCYHPDILPFRWDKERLRRMENLIVTETDALKKREQGSNINDAVRIIWTWICLFQNPRNSNDHYYETVERIFSMLSKRAVRYLASIRTDDGTPLIDVAPAEFARLLIARLGGKQVSDVAVPKGERMQEPGKLAAIFEESSRNGECRFQEDEICVATVCKKLFNIRHASLPTSFVILPYKLKIDPRGKTVLASPVYARVAIKFADCMVQMTDPQIVRVILKRKNTNKQVSPDRSIQDSADAESRLKTLEIRLLSLYEPDGGHLYLLDETDGSPVIPPSSEQNSLYPLLIRDPVTSVRTFLPLMISGMMLMKGKKAFNAFAKVMLAGKPEVIPSYWLEAAKNLIQQFSWKNHGETTSEETSNLNDQLVEFFSQAFLNTAEYPTDCDGSEWKSELALIESFVNKYDPSKTFAGLTCYRTKSGICLWKAHHQNMVAAPSNEKREQSKSKKAMPSDQDSRALHEQANEHAISSLGSCTQKQGTFESNPPPAKFQKDARLEMKDSRIFSAERDPSPLKAVRSTGSSRDKSPLKSVQNNGRPRDKSPLEAVRNSGSPRDNSPLKDVRTRGNPHSMENKDKRWISPENRSNGKTSSNRIQANSYQKKLSDAQDNKSPQRNIQKVEAETKNDIADGTNSCDTNASRKLVRKGTGNERNMSHPNGLETDRRQQRKSERIHIDVSEVRLVTSPPKELPTSPTSSRSPGRLGPLVMKRIQELGMDSTASFSSPGTSSRDDSLGMPSLNGERRHARRSASPSARLRLATNRSKEDFQREDFARLKLGTNRSTDDFQDSPISVQRHGTSPQPASGASWTEQQSPTPAHDREGQLDQSFGSNVDINSNDNEKQSTVASAIMVMPNQSPLHVQLIERSESIGEEQENQGCRVEDETTEESSSPVDKYAVIEADNDDDADDNIADKTGAADNAEDNSSDKVGDADNAEDNHSDKTGGADETDLKIVQTESTIQFHLVPSAESRDSLVFSDITEYTFESASEFGAVSSVSNSAADSQAGGSVDKNGPTLPVPPRSITTSSRSSSSYLRRRSSRARAEQAVPLLPKWVRRNSDTESESSDKQQESDLPLLPPVANNDKLLRRKGKRLGKSSDSQGSARSRPNASSSLDDVKLLKNYLDRQTSQLAHMRNKLDALQAVEQKLVIEADYAALEDLADELQDYDADSVAAKLLKEEEDAYISREACINGGSLKTRKLLHRLCELEERILTREIDLQHLKLDVHLLELDAATSRTPTIFELECGESGDDGGN